MVSAKPVGREERKPRKLSLGLCRKSKEQSSVGPTQTSRILEVLRAQTSHDFARYKQSAILRGIESRIVESGIGDSNLYASYLESHQEEVQVLLRSLLIQVTSFFRNPEAFAVLRRIAIPELLRDRLPGHVFRVWVPGCSTGEEVYSLAFLFQQVAEEAGRICDFHILGTDINEQAVSFALAGRYPHSIALAIPPEQLRRFFNRDTHGYRLRTEIRAMVAFSVQNVLMHVPSIQVDLISCRNLLIYLEADLQAELIAAFHRALRPGGVLFLSPSESVGHATELFSPISRKWKLYRADSPGPLFIPSAQLGAASVGL